MELDANLIIKAIQNQRDSALNEAAVLAARVMALEAKIKEFETPKEESKSAPKE